MVRSLKEKGFWPRFVISIFRIDSAIGHTKSLSTFRSNTNIIKIKKIIILFFKSTTIIAICLIVAVRKVCKSLKVAPAAKTA